MGMPIPLGTVIKDRLTGYTGVAVACTYWLDGCIRYAIVPMKVNKDGRPAEELWFDIQRIEVLKTKSPVLDTPKKHAKKHAKKSGKPPGGPQHDPVR